MARLQRDWEICEAHCDNPDSDQDDQPNHQNCQKRVDLIGDAVETADQRFRWLVISWSRPVHLGFNLSRPRLAGLSKRVIPRSTRPPLSDDGAATLSVAAAGCP